MLLSLNLRIMKNESSNKEKKKSEGTSSRVLRLRGILKIDSDFEYEKVLTEELSKKYDIGKNCVTRT